MYPVYAIYPIYAGLRKPIDEENDVIEPTLDAAVFVTRKLDEEAAEYDSYKEKLKKWKELQAFIKSKKNLNDIDGIS